jgi:hypothetical protein
MAITKDDLRDFNRFADERLETGGANSLVELAGEWEAQRREARDTIADVGECHVEIDADTLSALVAAFPDAQDPRRLKQALARRGGVTTAELLAKAAAAAQKANQQ